MASYLATHNLSLYTVPVGWLVAFLPRFYTAIFSGKSFDPENPRTFSERLKDNQTIDKATIARIHRAEAAQANGFENLGLYAAAIVAGNMALLPTSTLNYLSLAYLGSRVVYNGLYIWKPALRTPVYFGGFGCIVGLFVLSGNVLGGRGVVV